MSVIVLDEATPIARKEHVCEVCWGTIGVGDTYLRQRNVGDDGAYTFKGHRLCWALSLRIAEEAGMWTDEGEWPEPDEVRHALAAFFASLSSVEETQ